METWAIFPLLVILELSLVVSSPLIRYGLWINEPVCIQLSGHCGHFVLPKL